MRGGSGHRAAGGQKATDAERDVIVLVVDDEPVIRAFVARALAQAGFTTDTAGDGREALRLVAEDRVRPAILVTDIEMPGMTGIELAARLLALRPALRVVMMTGDTERATAARGHPSIVDAVLMKPMQVTELVDAVRSTGDRTPVG
jgi:DNA-binding response OmpR family regulator